jgi:hypothetical protein
MMQHVQLTYALVGRAEAVLRVEGIHPAIGIPKYPGLRGRSWGRLGRAVHTSSCLNPTLLRRLDSSCARNEILQAPGGQRGWVSD